MNKKIQLPIILATAFLDVLGLAIFIPVLPEIVERFGIASSWSGYTQGIYALGMFVGGLIFGRLSDTRGRKKMLSFTSVLNLISYILLAISIWNLPEVGVVHTDIWTGFTALSLLFLISRLIGGFGGAGYGVTQAYISDISRPANRAKNFGLIGAMFGLGFLVGPAIGAILSDLFSIRGAIIACIGVIALNVILIWIFLDEPMKHIDTENLDVFQEFRFSREIYVLLILTFGATVAFASVQSMSAQYYKDVFDFSPKQIGYTMSVVGLVSILYQGLIVKYVRKIFDEVSMIHIAFGILIIGFLGFSLNTSPIFLYFWVIFFPLGMGSFHPSVGSLLSQKAGKEVGKVMGYNTSIASIGQIIGPLFMGTVYSLGSITILGYTISHYIYPFLAGFLIFIVLFLFSLLTLRKN